jgi:hypothetical protein
MTIKSLYLAARKGELSFVLDLNDVARLMVSHELAGCLYSDFIKAADFLTVLADAGELPVQRAVRQIEVPNTYEVFRLYDNSDPRNYVSVIHRKPGQLGEWQTSICHEGKSARPAGARSVYRDEIGEPEISAENLSICLSTYQSEFEKEGFNSEALQAWLKQHGASLDDLRVGQLKVAAAALVTGEEQALPRAQLARDYLFWNIDVRERASFNNRFDAVRKLDSGGVKLKTTEGLYYASAVATLALRLLPKPCDFRKKTEAEAQHDLNKR